MVESLIVGEARIAGEQGDNKQRNQKTDKRRMPSQRYTTQPSNRSDLTHARNMSKRVASILQRISSQYEESLDRTDVKILVEVPQQKPEFPFLMVFVAILKDILDIPLELTFVGIVFTTVFSLIIGLVLFMWCLGKISGGWWKKKIIGWLWKRYIFTIILEFIPFIKIIPVTTIFVFMVHYRELKLVKIANQVLEDLKKSGLLSFI